MSEVRPLRKYHFRPVIGVVAALLGLALPIIAIAQQTTPLAVEDALKVRSFGPYPARFSPDGEQLAYTVQDNQRKRPYTVQSVVQTGVPYWALGADIFVANVASSNPRNITRSIGDNWLPVWSPDGHYLAFLSDRDGEDHARLWVWNAKNGDLRRISAVAVRAFHFEWTPDSRAIVVTVLPEGFSKEEVSRASTPGKKDASAASTIPGATVVLYHGSSVQSENENSFKSDPWNLDAYLRDLVIVDVDSGNALTLVHLQRIAEFRLAPNGSAIAYTVPKRFEKPGSQQILFDLAIVPMGKSERRVLASDIRLDYEGAAFSWSPDSLYLAFRNGGWEERTFDCHITRVGGGGLRNVSAFPASQMKPAYKLGTPVWDPKGDSVYFLRDNALWRSSVEGSKAEVVAGVPGRRMKVVIQRSGQIFLSSDNSQATVITHDDLGKQDGFYGVDVNHRTSFRLMEKAQCYTCASPDDPQFVDVSKDGREIAFYAEDAQHSADLWVSDPAFRRIKRLTHINPQFDNVAMGQARLIEWQDADGQSLKGALLLPSNYHEGNRYPLIVWVYGGASFSDRLDRFALAYDGPLNMHLFATRGYAILVPDAPQRMGTPMADLAKTVLPGVDKAIELGIADPGRLAVMGHSYGGYSTLALIVQTKRFKAAVDIDGFGDLISAYGQMDRNGTAYHTAIMDGGQGLMGGTPWLFRSRYIENSPVFFLDRVETPLLIVHGAQDTTVAPFLADEVFVDLRRLGKKVEYAKYEGEDHSPTDYRYANQLDFCVRMIAWFEKYTKTERQ